ncbi:MAG: hypothetical protein K8R21_14335 [Leptospira sp.]|nr:hypothetical protein [Leptospira sp.]
MIRNAVSLLSLFFLSCYGGKQLRGFDFIPAATIIRAENYKVLGRSEGESSTFFILNLFPVNKPLNIEYALSQAVQKIPGGQTMVNIQLWHETHYFWPLGRVSAVKVSGDVVSFGEVKVISEEDLKKNDQTKNPLPGGAPGGIKVGGPEK